MKKYRIFFGSYDDTQNYDWAGIREIMGAGEMTDLEEMTFTKEKAEELKQKLDNSDYTAWDVEIVEVEEELSLVDKAIKASSDYYRHPLFKVKKKPEGESWDIAYHDAPYALMYWNEELLSYRPCWGLPGDATLREALKDFDFLEEQFKDAIESRLK